MLLTQKGTGQEELKKNPKENSQLKRQRIIVENARQEALEVTTYNLLNKYGRNFRGGNG